MDEHSPWCKRKDKTSPFLPGLVRVAVIHSMTKSNLEKKGLVHRKTDSHAGKSGHRPGDRS